MEVGDLVESVPPHLLACGQMKGYRVAVVVSVHPFVLVSVGGSMLWGQVHQDEVRSLGPAWNHDIDTQRAFARFELEKQWRASLNTNE